MNTTFTFTTREQYLAFVAQWKADYQQLSNEIRAAKLAYKAAQRSDVYRDIIKALGTILILKADARAAINLRHSAKEEAQRQYEAAKEIA